MVRRLVAAVVVVVVALGAVALGVAAAGGLLRAPASATARVAPSTDVPSDPQTHEASWAGTYVWSRVLADGRAILRIERSDLERRLGTRGWPGCPADGICTRHGQLTVVLEPSGHVEIAWNAQTSSDFVRTGRYVVDGGRIRFALDDAYSCAHPGAALPGPRTLEVEASVDGDTLTLAIAPSGIEPWPLEEGSAARASVVFRRVTDARELRSLPFRACQGGRGHACRAECSRLESLLR